MFDFTWDLPENYYFGGGTDGTFATPLSVVLLILAITLMMALPRKYAIVPFLLAGILIPLNVSLVVFGLDFNANRILLLAGWTRILARGERCTSNLNSLDKVILFGALVNSIAYILVLRQTGAIINRGGFLFSALGTYLLLRSWIQNKEDVIRVIKVFLTVVIVLAPLLWYEHSTQRNLFTLLGRPEISSLRAGQVRAAGPFAHPIIAGTFGVVLIPLFIGYWWHTTRAWFVATLGVASSIVIMVSSSSSTPVVTLLAGILALSMWPLRKKMKMVRWGIILALISLQMVMKAPIWYLSVRLSGVLGGSGWHRAMLIDNFVRHFFDWFLIGTRDNANWGWSMWDVDNAYVAAGLMGGLAGFTLFLAVFVYAYKNIGAARSALGESRRDARLVWAIGAALFANSIAFFGIVYFDQSIIAWYALLVMISVIKNFAKSETHAQPELGMTDTFAPAGGLPYDYRTQQ